jgi:hypothetical protein
MKKILLAIIVSGAMVAANAGTATATLTLNGTVSSSCTQTLSASTLNFTFVPGSTASPEQTNLTLACTAGSVLSALTAQSTNGWSFTVDYTLTNTGISSAYSASSSKLATTWSGVTGSTTAISELTAPITIDTNADALVIGLEVAPAQASNSLGVDTYSDTITFTSTF